jgi:hypothetical protein
VFESEVEFAALSFGSLFDDVATGICCSKVVAGLPKVFFTDHPQNSNPPV